MNYNEFSKLITDVNISFNNIPTQYLSDSVCDTIYRVYDCFIDIVERELNIDDDNFLCDNLVDMILGTETPTERELHTMYNYFIPELNINITYTQMDVEYWVEYIKECNDLIKDIIDTFGICENFVNSIGEIIDIVCGMIDKYIFKTNETIIGDYLYLKEGTLDDICKKYL